MIGDVQEQLALLRRRIAKIDSKYQGEPRPRAAAAAVAPAYGESESLPGAEVETGLGKHWETERLYERHRRHGSFEISDLAGLPVNLFDTMSGGQVRDAQPETWAFLDTETTGLAGGSGTCAFLVGVGRITRDGFRVRQFLMRDHGEEPSLLDAVAAHLHEFRVLVTYNGKAYDQPLLETRYRLNRARPPFDPLDHLDLLHGARRLWKLRLESCRLTALEREILGMDREGDIPGEMIPYIYFDYLRNRQALRLVPIFHHNAMDILTLACLCGIVPRAFAERVYPGVTHGAELAGLGRWWRRMGEHERALELFRMALAKNLSDDLMFQTMWDAALLEKKLGREAEAVRMLTDLAASPNQLRAPAFEELAKYYEHRERNFRMALDMTLRALDLAPTLSLQRRKKRLERRISSQDGCLI